MPKVVVFGTVVIDQVRKIDHWPIPGAYCEYSHEEWCLGGEAANTASYLRAWGLHVDLFGNDIGDSKESHWLKEQLTQKGLSTEHVPMTGQRTPFCDIYVTKSGQRTMFGQGWHAPTDQQFNFEGEWFTADPNRSQESVDAVKAAVNQGMNCYLMDFLSDLSFMPPGSYWQSSTDWVGGDYDENMEFVEFHSLKLGCTSLLTDGAKGVYVGRDGQADYYQSYVIEDVIDTTGAGDAFRSGMIYGLVHGWDFERSLHFAMGSGGLSCQSLGASAQIPTVAEITQLIS